MKAPQDWQFSAVCKDAGGYNRESVFLFTLTHNGRSYATTFKQGWGFREWKISRSPRRFADYWAKYRRPGKPVGALPQQKLSADAINAFDALTQPTKPTIDDVLFCVVLDAASVRHGETFEEWAEASGYDVDSRKAEVVYRGCVEEWQALVRLGANFDELEKLYQEN